VDKVSWAFAQAIGRKTGFTLDHRGEVLLSPAHDGDLPVMPGGPVMFPDVEKSSKS